MEVFAFILQRFYWSLGAGFIINFFVIVNFHILIKKITFHKELLFLYDLLEIPVNISIWIFIVATIIIGILTEGINEIGTQYYAENKEKMYKKEYDPNERNIYKKLNFKGKLLYYIFRQHTTVEACITIEKYENEKKKIRETQKAQNKEVDKKYNPSPIYNFLRDPQTETAVTGMQKWAKYASLKDKTGSVYIFRDLAFMVQLIRTSSLIILLISFFALIIVFIFWGIQFLFWWYLATIVFSLLLFFLTTSISIYFGKRYVRDVGTSYNAFKIAKEETKKKKFLSLRYKRAGKK